MLAGIVDYRRCRSIIETRTHFFHMALFLVGVRTHFINCLWLGTGTIKYLLVYVFQEVSPSRERNDSTRDASLSVNVFESIQS
jgi:hypothetical protein